MRKFVKSAASLAALASVMCSAVSIDAADAQSVFEKIGDGWKHGKWIPGVPDVKPQTWQEVVFPVCWGSPQDCRDEADAKAGANHPPLYQVSFTVDCTDVGDGRPRGDSTSIFTSSTSIADARNKTLAAYGSSDLCQANPNYQDASRRMIPGSGHFDG